MCIHLLILCVGGMCTCRCYIMCATASTRVERDQRTDCWSQSSPGFVCHWACRQVKSLAFTESSHQPFRVVIYLISRSYAQMLRSENSHFGVENNKRISHPTLASYLQAASISKLREPLELVQCPLSIMH